MIESLTAAIQEFSQERGISQELVQQTIESALCAAYKKTYGTDENAVVEFLEDKSVKLYARKTIVEEVNDEALELSLAEALNLNDASEVGDTLLMEIDPHGFNRIAILTAKQSALQMIRQTKRDALYAEYSNKIGDMVVGYFQRERRGTIFVDLGNTEGILPKKFQSPRESYRSGDRIKVLIYKIEKTNSELQIIISRTHPEFVLRIFELEVPEVYDRTVEIVKVAREPGYRTKLMVRSSRSDVDPVGACVGVRGVRILSIIRELEGEKIDIIKYSSDPREFIKDSLAPATVKNVVVMNEAKHQALVVVTQDQLSLCIGKMGLNVRLANRLTDWNIDIKTEEQFAEMDIATESRRAVSELFESEEEITDVSELPNITEELVSILRANEISRISDLVVLSPERLSVLKGMTTAHVEKITSILESIVVVEQQESETAREGALETPERSEQDAEEASVAQETDATDDEEKEEALVEEETADEDRLDEDEEEEEAEDISIDELSSVLPERILQALKDAGIAYVIDLLNYDREQLQEIQGVNDEDAELVLRIIEENVNVVEVEEE